MLREINNESKRDAITALVVGVALTILAIQIDKYLTFTPFHLIFQTFQWQVGPRDIAHMIGLAGFTVTLWYFLRSFTSRLLIVLNIMMAVSAAFSVSLDSAENDWLYKIAGISAYELAGNILPIFLLACVLLGLAAWKTPRLLGPRSALIFSCLTLVVATAIWEFYVQPFDNVYGAAPRGWIEKAQVVCDLVGIFIGYLIVKTIRTPIAQVQPSVAGQKNSHEE